MPPSLPRIRFPVPILRVVLATLALIGQLAFAPLPAQARLAADSVTALQAVTVLCHSQPDHPDRVPGTPSRPRAPDDGTGCRANLLLELPAVIPTPAPSLPRRFRPVAVRLARGVSIRAPPAATVAGPYARAPPDPA